MPRKNSSTSPPSMVPPRMDGWQKTGTSRRTMSPTCSMSFWSTCQKLLTWKAHPSFKSRRWITANTQAVLPSEDSTEATCMPTKTTCCARRMATKKSGPKNSMSSQGWARKRWTTCAAVTSAQSLEWMASRLATPLPTWNNQMPLNALPWMNPR